MKKLLVLLLVLTMVIGLGTTALAEPNDPESITEITFTKTFSQGYKGNGETFNFTIVPDGGNDNTKPGVLEGLAPNAPAINNGSFSITVNNNEISGDVTIDLPNFTNVGKYQYKITEQTPTNPTAGMDYTNEATLTILVVNQVNNEGEIIEGNFLYYATFSDTGEGEKVGEFTFTNTFNDESGSLKVEKKLEGNYADKADEDNFEVEVTLSPEDSTKLNANAIIWGTLKEGSTLVNNSDGSYTATYTIEGENNFTINNIPLGVEFKVEETNNGGRYIDGTTYTIGTELQKDDEGNNAEFATGTINGDKTVTITNFREIDILVGVVLDNLPYILVIGLAVLGLAIFMVSRRRRYN